MARRPSRTSSGSRGSSRSSGGAARGSRSGGGRGGGGRGGAGGRGNARGRSSGGGSNNTGMILGAVGLLVVVGAVAMFMGGDDKKKDGEGDIVKKSDVVAKTDARGTANETWDSGNGSSSSTTKTESSNKRGAKFRDYIGKVDRKTWNEVEDLFAEARKLKVKAEDARKAGNEAEFRKIMGQAVRTWRKGDLKSELFMEEVDQIKDGMWDAMFKTEQKKLERMLRDFRGFIMFEEEK